MTFRPHDPPAKPASLPVHPMAEIADTLIPDPASSLGKGVDPHSAVRALLISLEGLSPQRVLEALADTASGDPKIAQQGLLAWGSDRRVAGNLDLRGLSWVSRLPDGLIVLGEFSLDGAESVRDWVGANGTRQWKESPVTLIPQGVRVGQPRRQEHAANRVEGSERRDPASVPPI